MQFVWFSHSAIMIIMKSHDSVTEYRSKGNSDSLSCWNALHVYSTKTVARHYTGDTLAMKSSEK